MGLVQNQAYQSSPASRPSKAEWGSVFGGLSRLAHMPFVLFLPFLLIYGVGVALGSGRPLHGDEPGYLSYAANLSHGYYSPANDVLLWWGPGYPIVLLPFVALGLPYAV